MQYCSGYVHVWDVVYWTGWRGTSFWAGINWYHSKSFILVTLEPKVYQESEHVKMFIKILHTTKQSRCVLPIALVALEIHTGANHHLQSTERCLLLRWIWMCPFWHEELTQTIQWSALCSGMKRESHNLNRIARSKQWNKIYIPYGHMTCHSPWQETYNYLYMPH